MNEVVQQNFQFQFLDLFIIDKNKRYDKTNHVFTSCTGKSKIVIFYDIKEEIPNLK